MDGAQIRVGNSRENNGINNKMCTKIKNFNRGQWNDFPCTKQVSGRYVTVSFPDKKALILCEVEIYGKKRDPINTANSITSQSSNYTADVSYSSGRATDGNKTACAHTEDKQKPWWRIDLLGFYDISGISIYNTKRTHTNMTGAQIHVGNSRENNGINNKMCTEIENFKGGEWNDFRCTEHVSGRYVTVSLPGERHLILCEVEIYGKKRDLINTTNSITSQSSDYTAHGVSYSSGRATDGNEKLCANTNDKQKPWWRIDLLGFYNISCVSIYSSRRNNVVGAQIHVGNSRENNGINNKICANMTPFIEEQWNNYTCAEQVSGRYVTVSFPETRFLILCEVEIYGKRKASPFKLIKENKTWEHALEHCRGNGMDLATILDEDDQTLAELEARKADTPFLWLGLHYTCILEVWFWVADHRLEFNRWADGEKTGDCDRSAVMERAEGHKWFSKSDYDEFNFICQKF
uniref:C-type lectin domain-containing protein n=1 Tax=Sparus aurata TaxID=8175 RepID=A0A671Z2V0_SPAAU